MILYLYQMDIPHGVRMGLSFQHLQAKKGSFGFKHPFLPLNYLIILGFHMLRIKFFRSCALHTFKSGGGGGGGGYASLPPSSCASTQF
jgi:hypothetical protein